MSKAAASFARRVNKYEGTVEITVHGIPCLAGVTSYLVVAGNRRADTPDDYYGYCELDWEVLDRKGYPAPWLSRMMTEDEESEAERLIHEYMEDEADGAEQDYWDNVAEDRAMGY